MPNTELPKVNRVDFTEEETMVLCLMLQAQQAKMQMDLHGVFTVGATLAKLGDSRLDLFKSIGLKLDTIVSQEDYDRVVAGMLGMKWCPKCEEYHA